jgi:hypothetical protein
LTTTLFIIAADVISLGRCLKHAEDEGTSHIIVLCKYKIEMDEEQVLSILRLPATTVNMKLIFFMDIRRSVLLIEEIGENHQPVTSQ